VKKALALLALPALLFVAMTYTALFGVDAPAVAAAPFEMPAAGSGKHTFSPLAAGDLGRVDPRLTAILTASPWNLHVGIFISGHHFCVNGSDPCRMSNHIPGRAMDIMRVGGKVADASNPEARAFLVWLNTFTPRPDEVGSPFREFDSLPGKWFTDADHMTHFHVGFSA
jgi:hypothetical protein